MKKIRLDFKYCERGRFYRTLLVKEDINLVDLGCAILTAFNAAFEHCFYFRTKDYFYNPRVFMEDAMGDNEVLMDDYTLEALGEKFEFCYDTGEGWDFNAKVYKKTVENEDEENDVILVDGAGLGIFEDNIHTLMDYLRGELDSEAGAEEDDDEEEYGYYSLPWNLDMKKYSDFDEAFHIEKEIERFNSDYFVDRITYQDMENIKYSPEDNDDEELLDDEEAGEPNEKSNERLHYYLIQVVQEQIKNLDYVEETYQRLLKSNSDEEAIDKIARVLVTEIYYIEKEKREFDEEKYKKELSELE